MVLNRHRYWKKNTATTTTNDFSWTSKYSLLSNLISMMLEISAHPKRVKTTAPSSPYSSGSGGGSALAGTMIPSIVTDQSILNPDSQISNPQLSKSMPSPLAGTLMPRFNIFGYPRLSRNQGPTTVTLSSTGGGDSMDNTTIAINCSSQYCL